MLITGVKLYNINLHDERVTVETNLPSDEIQHILEETGRKAILRGHGTVQGIRTWCYLFSAGSTFLA